MAAAAEQASEIVNEQQPRFVSYTHDALVTDRTAAETSASAQAIRDVVHAIRSATVLKKS
jgi:hypothetical protein